MLMNKISKEFANSNIMQAIYLLHIYEALNNCTSYHGRGNYEIAFQALYEDFYFIELLKYEWGKELISLSTIQKLKGFHHEWKKFVKEKPYGDSFFVFYDQEYHELISQFLIPSLELFENDIISSNIAEIYYEDVILKFTSYRESFDPRRRPSDEDMVWKITNLCDLLLNQHLLKKPFMGNESESH